MSNPPPDPVVDEVREARRRISAQCGHDPARLVAYYRELQKTLQHRLLAPASPPAPPEATVAS